MAPELPPTLLGTSNGSFSAPSANFLTSNTAFFRIFALFPMRLVRNRRNCKISMNLPEALSTNLAKCHARMISASICGFTVQLKGRRCDLKEQNVIFYLHITPPTLQRLHVSSGEPSVLCCQSSYPFFEYFFRHCDRRTGTAF